MIPSGATEFTIVPNGPITLGQKKLVTEIVNRIKPAHSVFTVDEKGIGIHNTVRINSIESSSDHYEVIRSTHTKQHVGEYLTDDKENSAAASSKWSPHIRHHGYRPIIDMKWESTLGKYPDRYNKPYNISNHEWEDVEGEYEIKLEYNHSSNWSKYAFWVWQTPWGKPNGPTGDDGFLGPYNQGLHRLERHTGSTDNPSYGGFGYWNKDKAWAYNLRDKMVIHL